MEQLSLLAEPPSIYSVSSLTAAVHQLLSRAFNDIRVAGEISGYKVSQSGHAYFTLKDSGAQLRCVLFRNALRYLKFRPHDGLAVVARGSVEVYQDRGEYQLVVSSLEPQGLGALQLAFEQLKQRLSGEGLFDQARKRPIPALPRRIGLVTSPTGAAIRDMLSVLTRRFPGLHIRLYPTTVQGEGSVRGVCAGLDYFSNSGWADVVIVGRGGGSLEDLWTFNEEPVARAIAESNVPVVSAVGHETDFTIADFVADLRAPTPSAAAELIVKNRADLLRALESSAAAARRAVHLRISIAARRLHEQGIQRASTLLQRRMGRASQRLDESLQTLRRHDPRFRLAKLRQRLQQAGHDAAQSMRRQLGQARLRLDPLSGRLVALSPFAVLSRGYAIIENEQQRVVKSPDDAPPGTTVEARLANGRLRARVTP
jgi:exodeoxyribonuclease VII large subunit